MRSMVRNYKLHEKSDKLGQKLIKHEEKVINE